MLGIPRNRYRLVHDDESFYAYQPVFVGRLQRRKTSLHSMYVIFFLFAICQQRQADMRKNFYRHVLY
jgi:hypothetical protein